MPIVQPADIDRVVAAILQGEVVAIPTDTVYGLVARADDPAAVDRIAALKGRSATQAVQLLISAIEVIAPHVDNPHALERVRPFWPGGVTAIVRVRPGYASAVVTPEGTVGVRVPDHELALAVLEACGGALAASSANRHGEPPARSAAGILEALGDDVLVLDGGPSIDGVASTVIDLASTPPRIMRTGPISARDLGLG